METLKGKPVTALAPAHFVEFWTNISKKIKSAINFQPLESSETCMRSFPSLDVMQYPPILPLATILVFSTKESN